MQLTRPKFSMAVKIISEPVYYSPYYKRYREVTSIDKPRILYQYYDLNKKAYEIITNTPEVQTEKIKNIKRSIESGSYDVKYDKITQNIINDIFMDDILLSKG